MNGRWQKIQKSCEFKNEPTQIDNKYIHTEQRQENRDNVI